MIGWANKKVSYTFLSEFCFPHFRSSLRSWSSLGTWHLYLPELFLLRTNEEIQNRFFVIRQNIITVLRQLRLVLLAENLALKWVYSALFTTILLTPSTFMSLGNCKPPRLCLQRKNEHRRSDRSRHSPANSQIMLYSHVARTQTYQSPMVYFFSLMMCQIN